MKQPDSPSPPNAGESRAELDGLVVNIELTLISITQGVALYFLIDNARALWLGPRPGDWLYAASGLVVLLLFWSRAMMHTLTLIRWPLEFVHNFFYVACAMFEAIMFAHLGHPAAWFALNAALAVLAECLFIFDQRLIRLRRAEASRAGSAPRAAGTELYALIAADQRLNIRLLVPVLLALYLGAWLVWRQTAADDVASAVTPTSARNLELLLLAFQLIGLLVYLTTSVRQFARLAPLIVRARGEWRSAD
ncbi:MAG: hypothetical protein JO117_09240 [Verrucomicrobia bacterium]|nr:hypothetical protein [Verrucomicrobiota bacterium]